MTNRFYIRLQVYPGFGLGCLQEQTTLEDMMKKTKIVLALMVMNFSLSSWALEIRPQTCGVPQADEPLVYNSDFSWGMNRDDIFAKEKEIYESGKRLQKRAHLNEEGELVVSVSTVGDDSFAKVPASFIKSIRAHIENSLKRKYVDSIIFPDMGHSHFFMKEDFFNTEIAPLPISQRALGYERMMNNPELRVLYHTAEQLTVHDEDKKLLDDRILQWRFYTRNLVGDNKKLGKMELLHAEDHRHNTAHDYEPGYRYWGAGFYVSVSKDGCFPFTRDGETQYFDINFTGLASDMNNGGYWD